MFRILVVVSNIVIGLYVPEMCSVLCVPYLCGGILYSDRTIRTGQVVSAVCSVCGWWYLI